jgi:acyl-CoA thioester hydrolase
MTINLASIPPDGRHRYAIRVYYEDTDAGGVVYHATYLRYAERARTEALRDLGVPHADMVGQFGVMFMVRRLEVDYERGARLDQALTVETEVLEVGGASVRLRQTVREKDGSEGEGGAVCAVLAVRLACVRLDANKPGRIPPLWRERLTAMRSRRDENLARHPPPPTCSGDRPGDLSRHHVRSGPPDEPVDDKDKAGG